GGILLVRRRLRRACAGRAVRRRVQALPVEREAMVTAHHPLARIAQRMSEPTLTFATPSEWEAWLEADGSASSGAWLRLAKKSADQPTLTYAQALEVALCHGWIDGQKRSEGEHH